MKLISIVAPAFNEELNLRRLYNEICKNIEGLPYQFEIVIAENGSSDSSLQILKEMNIEDSRLRYVSLSRNFGSQGGLLAGLQACRGDAVITMDADLQHPPMYIPQMIAEWEKGFKVVNTHKASGREGVIRPFLDKLFYGMMDRFIGFPMGQADFRLLDRLVLKELLELPEAEKFVRGLIAWLGFKTATIPYKLNKRTHGVSKYRLSDLIKFAFNAITSFSTLPLTFLTRIGFILLLPSLAYLVFTFGIGLFTIAGVKTPFMLPPGWLTLTFSMVFFGSIQLLALGILGEYVGRIYIETKSRPSFVVREKSD